MLICPYCDSEARLSSSLLVYKKYYGNIWVCPKYPDCDAYVGCHRNGDAPLGRLADKELRFWKQRAHQYFDVLWKEKVKKIRKQNKKEGKSSSYKNGEARTKAYKWLSIQLGIELKDCHIGMFDVSTCQKVAEICFPYAKKYLYLKDENI